MEDKLMRRSLDAVEFGLGGAIAHIKMRLKCNSREQRQISSSTGRLLQVER
ncbi:MAG: hypothetical protein V7K35_18825 [Nostoc sp.]|uniref:hypothetical protein n=1 Tax=Nostoc sp. TaxID=1180 RepID=UPI002FF97992